LGIRAEFFKKFFLKTHYFLAIKSQLQLYQVKELQPVHLPRPALRNLIETMKLSDFVNKLEKST